MTQDIRRSQLSDIYQKALAQLSSERERFLKEACGDNDALRQDVASLLALDALADRFLESPAVVMVAQTMAAIISEDPPPIDTRMPPPLRWVIDGCLAKDPASRYESSRDLFRDRSRFATSSPKFSTEAKAAAIRPLRGGLAAAGQFRPRLPPSLNPVQPRARREELRLRQRQIQDKPVDTRVSPRRNAGWPA